jgi:ribosomal protein S18 acetylase RimI-like enzyme
MIEISCAELHDARAILELQRLAYQSEARLYNDWSLPPLTQTLESLESEFAHSIVLKAVASNRIVGSVRGRAVAGIGQIGRLIVHPDYQGQGIGSALLERVEASMPDVGKYELFTGTRSDANIRLYRRHGYRITRQQDLSPTLSVVFMEKSG